MTHHGASVTGLLSRWKQGDRDVENQLAQQIYPMLRVIAEGQIRRNGGQSCIRPTALVSDAYERLAEQKAVDWQNREHFYAIAATILRRVLIDFLRQQHAEKRGGDLVFLALDHPDSNAVASDDQVFDCLALDQALIVLGKEDPAAARVVELRLFSCLGIEQIARLCGASVSTVSRQWRFARAWLAANLGNTKELAEAS